MASLKSLERMRFAFISYTWLFYVGLQLTRWTFKAFNSMQFPNRLREAVNNAKCIYVDTNMSSGSILSSSEPAKKLISYGTATDWSDWQKGGVAGLLTKVLRSFEGYGNVFGICELATCGRIDSIYHGDISG